MGCNKVQDSLSLLIDDRLSTLDAKQTNKHLSNCSDCREEFNALKGVSELVGSLDEKSPPEDFSNHVIKECINSGEVKPQKNISTLYSLRNAAVAAIIFFFILGNSFIWAFSDGFMTSDKSHNDNIDIKVDMRLAGPNIQVRDVSHDEEADVQKASSKELTNDMGRYNEDDGGFLLASMIGDYSSYLIFNGMYIPVAAAVIIFLRMKDDKDIS